RRLTVSGDQARDGGRSRVHSRSAADRRGPPIAGDTQSHTIDRGGCSATWSECGRVGGHGDNTSDWGRRRNSHRGIASSARCADLGRLAASTEHNAPGDTSLRNRRLVGGELIPPFPGRTWEPGDFFRRFPSLLRYISREGERLLTSTAGMEPDLDWRN